MPAYLGLDCGGTKTLAMVCDESGEVLYEKRSGPANFASTPRDLIQKHLKEVISEAPTFDAVCICMAGILTENDKAEAESMVRDIVGECPVEVRPDTHASWAATEGQADLLVIAGTGAIICSEQNGTINKSGGGGPIFGDEGSAASVGRRSLYYTVVSAEQLPASNNYWKAVEEQFGTVDHQSIIAAVYACDSPAAKFAKLAKSVGVDAVDGLEYATLTVSIAMNLLAEETLVHTDRYQPDLKTVRICLAGGLWKIHPIFREQFESALDERNIVCDTLNKPPVYGAVQLAKQITT